MGLFSKLKQSALKFAYDVDLISVDTYVKHCDDQDLKNIYNAAHEETTVRENQHNIESQIEKELEARRNQYKMSSTARIDYEEFFDSGRSTQSHLFAQYLSDACEENIPIIANFFMKAHTDRKYVESEVAAYLYFCCYMLIKATNLDTDEINIKCSIQNDKKGRDDEIYWNRRMIYEDIYFGSPVRAHWDFNGDLIKHNDNPLIFCLMAMSDFIWEPHLKNSTYYDEYYSKPLTIKSIDQAIGFQLIYADANMQTALFMEMIAGTARNLQLL